MIRCLVSYITILYVRTSHFLPMHVCLAFIFIYLFIYCSLNSLAVYNIIHEERFNCCIQFVFQIYRKLLPKFNLAMLLRHVFRIYILCFKCYTIFINDTENKQFIIKGYISKKFIQTFTVHYKFLNNLLQET